MLNESSERSESFWERKFKKVKDGLKAFENGFQFLFKNFVYTLREYKPSLFIAIESLV